MDMFLGSRSLKTAKVLLKDNVIKGVKDIKDTYGLKTSRKPYKEI